MRSFAILHLVENYGELSHTSVWLVHARREGWKELSVAAQGDFEDIVFGFDYVPADSLLRYFLSKEKA